jgi:hypothetical protein
MVFNGDANNQDICTYADKWVKTDDTDFPLADKAMYANSRLREIFLWIWSVYGGWIQDDSNNSGEPEVSTNLVTTPRNLYAFATAQLIDAVEWLDANGDWNQLVPITLEEINSMGYAETEFMSTAGRPEYYRPTQTGIRIYPDSDAARNNALKARLRRDIAAFTAASTSTAPGFDSILHEGLSIGMALTHAKINRLEIAVDLQREWDGNEEVTKQEGGFKKRVKDHYLNKFRQHFPKIRNKGEHYADQFVS